jgi:hypothetical protein
MWRPVSRILHHHAIAVEIEPSILNRRVQSGVNVVPNPPNRDKSVAHVLVAVSDPAIDLAGSTVDSWHELDLLIGLTDAVLIDGNGVDLDAERRTIFA